MVSINDAWATRILTCCKCFGASVLALLFMMWWSIPSTQRFNTDQDVTGTVLTYTVLTILVLVFAWKRLRKHAADYEKLSQRESA